MYTRSAGCASPQNTHRRQCVSAERDCSAHGTLQDHGDHHDCCRLSMQGRTEVVCVVWCVCIRPAHYTSVSTMLTQHGEPLRPISAISIHRESVCLCGVTPTRKTAVYGTRYAPYTCSCTAQHLAYTVRPILTWASLRRGSRLSTWCLALAPTAQGNLRPLPSPRTTAIGPYNGHLGPCMEHRAPGSAVARVPPPHPWPPRPPRPPRPWAPERVGEPGASAS